MAFKAVTKLKGQGGFTLIELIMVIVILGILSAFALPKFADLSGSAQVASVEGVRAALKSGAAIAHAQWLANGSTGNVDLEGTEITITNGYPDQADLNDLVDMSDFTQINATDAGYRIITLSLTGGDPCITYVSATSGNTPTISVLGTHTGDGSISDTCAVVP